jgi:RNA polymerase sigma-70 factor (ECF subfamily)
MLQTVLGLDAARIASAFLVSPATMGQRLVRAKRKIAEARIPFAEPEPHELGDRSSAVLDAIYAAFGAGYDDGSEEGGGDDLSREALFLAEVAARLFAANAEAYGLLALMIFIDARRRARRAGGRYVPLDEQDQALWDRTMIAAAEATLARAASFGAPGRFQLEAAIQSAHVNARMSGVDLREAIVRLYDRLIAVAPSTGAAIARAAAMLRAGREEEALSALDALPSALSATHQPYWATRAHALGSLGRLEDARAAFDRAIGLTSDAGTRGYLLSKRNSLAR